MICIKIIFNILSRQSYMFAMMKKLSKNRPLKVLFIVAYEGPVGAIIS